MNWKAFFATTLAAGVVGNVIDMVVQGGWFNTAYYAKQPQLFRQDYNVAMLVLGDFLGVAVLAWFYQLVRSSFGAGWMNGLRFGAATGLVASFPLYIFLHLMLVNYPYSLSWAMTIYTIAWVAIIGAVAGLVHDKLG